MSFPLDSPYRISGASTTKYMRTCLLRATQGATQHLDEQMVASTSSALRFVSCKNTPYITRATPPYLRRNSQAGVGKGQSSHTNLGQVVAEFG
jgi:hypothetical protein